MTLKELHALRFVQPYSPDFRADPRPHKDFAHALGVHFPKALGHLAALVDELDHGASPQNSGVYAKYVADLAIFAARLAEKFPGGPIDLDAEVQKRAEDKGMLP
jgi:hypothetical protein